MCRNGADCDHVTGRCSCPPGWIGRYCEYREFFLARMTSNFNCQLTNSSTSLGSLQLDLVSIVLSDDRGSIAITGQPTIEF